MEHVGVKLALRQLLLLDAGEPFLLLLEKCSFKVQFVVEIVLQLFLVVSLPRRKFLTLARLLLRHLNTIEFNCLLVY